MLSKLFWMFRLFSRRLWVRAALISALAIVAAVAAPLLGPILPDGLIRQADEEAVRRLLDILANSMLAVTTFSLTVMVTAHFYAAQNVTPRAHRLLQEDTRTQTVLATFLGAFVYALTGTVILNSEIPSERELVVYYVATIAVIGLVIVAIVRWIGHLSGLGSLEATADRVEATAREALSLRCRTPFLGGRPLDNPEGQIPPSAHMVAAPRAGYVQHVDSAKLADLAGRNGGYFYLVAEPGAWVDAGEAVGFAAVESFGEALEREMAAHVTLGDVRTFAQDAEFGLAVLAEVAVRALSPGINDPRTAEDIIARLSRLLGEMTGEDPSTKPRAPAIFVPPLDKTSLVRAAFDAIGRDGAGMVEVAATLQAALRRLAASPDQGLARAAQAQSARALAHAEAALLLQEDIDAVRTAAPARKSAARVR